MNHQMSRIETIHFINYLLINLYLVKTITKRQIVFLSSSNIWIGVVNVADQNQKAALRV